MKKLLPDLLAILLFLLLSTCYFLTPFSQGLVLGGHDSVASQGLSQEPKEFAATHNGETSRWSNAIFSGMPTYQTAPSYESTTALKKAHDAYSLFTGHLYPAISYLFLYLLGFYILLRAFNFRPYLAALGAVFWAFSSYFLIIVAAGHIWKVTTLACIPPTIAGLILCYRRKYLAGTFVTALFTAFQVLNNHLQMTYYFLFPMLFIVVAYGVEALLRHTLKAWAKATACIAIAGLLGIAANAPNLYHTYTYAKHTMRGTPELTHKGGTAEAANATNGLDRDYITAWSYGIGETLTLLIPDYKGGGSASIIDRPGAEQLPGYDTFYQHAAATQQLFQQQGIQANPPGIMQYWGEQPFTVGPVYVGAAVCFLALLGLFIAGGPLPWALLVATFVSFVFAWGRHIPAVTDFLIDHLPLYAKFRTVSSALVVAEFTLPLLAVLGVAALIRKPERFDLTRLKEQPLAVRIGVPLSLLLTLGFCLLVWMVPSVAGDCLSAADREAFAGLSAAGMPIDYVSAYQGAVTEMRHAILSADALRSALVILVSALLLFAYAKGKLRAWMLCTLLAFVSLADLWQIDKRYLNDSSFSDPMAVNEDNFALSAADRQVLADTTYYRVCNISGGSPFNETTNATAYRHHHVGGYHAAKLRRYQDLIDHRLHPELQALFGAMQNCGGDPSRIDFANIVPTLSMLNTKYFMLGAGESSQAMPNPAAMGPAWFVQKLSYVNNADAEIKALDTLDPRREAVADAKFKDALGQAFAAPADSAATVRLLSNDLNTMVYETRSNGTNLLVFSEIYYPDWTATIDGKPAELGRVNYVLRALKVPAGTHQIKMEFKPASIPVTNGVAWAAMAVIALLFLLLILREVKKARA